MTKTQKATRRKNLAQEHNVMDVLKTAAQNEPAAPTAAPPA